MAKNLKKEILQQLQLLNELEKYNDAGREEDVDDDSLLVTFMFYEEMKLAELVKEYTKNDTNLLEAAKRRSKEEHG